MGDTPVRVAVRVRPLLPREVLDHHRVCVQVDPDSSQVILGSNRSFYFDHVFGPSATQDQVYEACVQPLLESLLGGYNATLFCYGQTGSGKTYTLGGGKHDGQGGIIDHVAEGLFSLIEEKKKHLDNVEVTVRATYVELYKEELRDLLNLTSMNKTLHIRVDEKGNTVLNGAKEVVVTSPEELLNFLEMGYALRQTAATTMNEHSSRSHAILTLQITSCCPSNNNSFTVRPSKLCLVDLAGSERPGKTPNTGLRFKESAHINTGLLALSNVIRALADQSRRGNHCVYIPYRNAKITRLLRDSLSGSAHTVIVACVSPSNSSFSETLSVLQFASKARKIQTNPRSMSIQTGAKSTLSSTWNLNEPQLGELKLELQILREMLKEKEREESEKSGRGDREAERNASELEKKVNREELSHYRLLAHEAAALLSDISGTSLNLSIRQRLQNWQERLTSITHSHETVDNGCSQKGGAQPDNSTLSQLRAELNKCQEALRLEEQLLEQKNAELRQAKKEIEKLLEERKTHLKVSQENSAHICIQKEQLVSQQILIDRLRTELMTFRVKSPGEVEVSMMSKRRAHSAPLMRHSVVPQSRRKIHSCPPAFSLENVRAAIKTCSHLLLAEIEGKGEVYCPFVNQQSGSKSMDQEEEEEDLFISEKGFSRSLNRTWTSQQRKPTQADPTCDGSPEVQMPHLTAGTRINQLTQSQMREMRKKANVTERQIHDLEINIRMKEELIKKTHRTEKVTKAVDKHDGLCSEDRDTGVFQRLSMESQQVRMVMYQSLQHMNQQKAQLQSSLKELRKNSDGKDNNLLHQNEEQSVKNVWRTCETEDSEEKLHGRCWLEEEEDMVLQRRVELKEVEEEWRKREEVLQQRDACLQQQNKLEIKMQRVSQTLHQDLLHVSMQLESVEQQLQGNQVENKSGRVTPEELEKERDMLKTQRDSLDDKLKNDRVLTAEEHLDLLQLGEAIEALDADVEFKSQSIQEKQKELIVSHSSLLPSLNTEPAQFCDVIRKLKKLSLPEALELLIKYFNKVVCLREAEHHFRLRCEELDLRVREQEAVIKGMESAMQRASLDTDRMFTQQHWNHHSNLQLLLQKLKDDVSEEAQQAIPDRVYHLEKELFFYKSSTRQLKKQLKEALSKVPQPVHQSSHTLVQGQMQLTQTTANQPPVTEETQMNTHITTAYTEILAGQTDDNRPDLRTQTPSSSSVFRKTKMSEGRQAHSDSQVKYAGGQSHENMEITPVSVCRRDLRQISTPDLQLLTSAARRRQSVVDSSTETILEDSIEASSNSTCATRAT